MTWISRNCVLGRVGFRVARPNVDQLDMTQLPEEMTQALESDYYGGASEGMLPSVSSPADARQG